MDKRYPNRETRAPYDRAIKGHPQFMNHAEEGVIAEFEDAVKKTGLKPEDVKANLYIHQSNPKGICNKCTLGLFEPHSGGKKGIFKQLTEKYPNLTIKASTEINPTVKPRDTLSFEVTNGITKNVVNNRKCK